MDPALRQVLRISSGLATVLADGGPLNMGTVTGMTIGLRRLLESAILPPTARKALQGAETHLGGLNNLESYVSVLSKLSKAAVALAAASRRAVPHLPPELLSLILHQALPEAPHFHDRQRTLITLASVSRQFHQIIRPILLAEIHLTRAHQLRGLDKLRRKNALRSTTVKLFTIQLDLSELRYQDDSTWLGCYLKPVVLWLSTSTQIRISLDSLSGPDLLTQARETRGAEDLYGEGWDFPGFFEGRAHIVEAHLDLPAKNKYADVCRYYAIVAPGPDLRRLYLPSTSATGEISGLIDEFFDEEVEFTRHSWEVLAAPHAAFFLPSLTAILPLGTAATLTHLEITLILPSTDPLATRLSNIQALFDQLAPSLRILVLRVRHSSWQDRQAVSVAIEEGLGRLTHLKRLAIGGVGLSRGVSASAFRKTSIESLTLLPLARRPEAGLPPNALHDHINGNRGVLRLLGAQVAGKKWFPKLKELEIQRGESQPPSAVLRQICERLGIVLRQPRAVDGWMYLG